MTGSPKGDGTERLVDRRSYLQMVGAATSASALATFGSGSVRGAVEHRGIQFERVVNLVDDYGADPTGSEPADDAIEAAADANTLIKVPDGEYLFSGELFLSPDGNFGVPFEEFLFPGQEEFGPPTSLGFLAEDGASPRFVAPDGFNDHLLNIYHISKALFEGIDIDHTAPDTTAGLRFDIEDRFHIQDVEFLGRGTSPDSDVTNALSLTVTNSSGVGIVRNVVAKKGSAIDAYKLGDGRSGAYVGRKTKGAVRFENCHFEEFGNNGLYVGRTPGDVQIVGGIYRNNNISQVRIGGSGSYVTNATVEVDLDKYTGSTPGTGTAYNTRGIVVDVGSVRKTPGALVKNCAVNIEKADNSTGGICVQDWSETNPQELYVEDTTITVNDGFRAIYSEGGPIFLRDVSIRGVASGGYTIHLQGNLASGTTISGACIEHTGWRRAGILADGAICSVEESTINVTDDAFLERNGGAVITSNVTFDGRCVPVDRRSETVMNGFTRTNLDGVRRSARQRRRVRCETRPVPARRAWSYRGEHCWTRGFGL